MSASSSADRNLLFGILALQMNFVNQDALVTAMSAWVLAKGKPISEILLGQGRMNAAQVRALDDLIALQLQAHKNDTRRSLEALQSISAIGERLTEIADEDMQESLACLSTLSRDDLPVRQRPTGNSSLRYEKEREHKHGGLGQVYVAKDTELNRRVALKEILPHRADDPASRARFILEAEITGGLEHPGIVPVYGFGTYADGRPYYAMRFIHGTNLRDAIEQFHDLEKPGRDPGERTLAFRQLLRRFVDACNAVAYAHNRGVLHRDLKPTNIMLGDFGETLVIDWGLAKAGVKSAKRAPADIEVTIDPTLQPSSGDLLVTNVGAAIGTPAFMSPEQAVGKREHINSTSDIYGLGATLYILLTGKKPFEGTTDAEIMGRVKSGKFSPPRQAKPNTPPALDGICCKAMALKPDDRYPSALDLAADIEHWLADEPVAAYPEPWRARAARWMRRHRTVVVAAVMFLGCAVVGLTISTGLIWREQMKTEEQRQLAEKNRADAVSLDDDLLIILSGAEAELAANPRTHKARTAALRDATWKTHSLRSAYPDDPALKNMAANLYRFTANVNRLENETTAAKSLYEECLPLFRELAITDRQQRVNVANTLRDMASLQANLGQLGDAAKSEDEAIQVIKGLREQAPSPGLSRMFALALVNRARIERARGDLDPALATAKEAEQLYAALVADPKTDPHPYDPMMRAAALNIAAVAERESGHMESASGYHQQAVEILFAVKDKPQAGLNPNDVSSFLIRFEREQCRTMAAIPEKRPSAAKKIDDLVAPAEALAHAFSTIPDYRQLSADVLQSRGMIRAQMGQAAGAKEDLERAEQLHLQLAEKFGQIPGYRAALAITQMELGKLARIGNDQAAAKSWFNRSGANFERAAAQSPDDKGLKRSLDELQTEMRQ